MTITNLLRFPGIDCPKEVLTGNMILDSYLIKVDQLLLGSGLIRLPYLLELRDHLEEYRERFMEDGFSEDEAAKATVDKLDNPVLYSKPQRSRVLRRFVQIIASMTVVVILFGFCLNLLEGMSITESIVMGWPCKLVCILLVAWFLTFAYPTKVLPTCLGPGGTFTVAYPKRTIILSFVVILVCLALLAECVFRIIGVNFNIPYTRELSASASVLSVAFIILLLIYVLLKCIVRRYQVSPQELTISKCFGSTDVPWGNIDKLTSVGERHSWLPLKWYWRDVYILAYRDVSGKTKKVLIPSEMENYDQLILIIREKLGLPKV